MSRESQRDSSIRVSLTYYKAGDAGGSKCPIIARYALFESVYRPFRSVLSRNSRADGRATQRSHFLRDCVPAGRKRDCLQPAQQRVHVEIESTFTVEEAREGGIQKRLLEVVDSRHPLWYDSIVSRVKDGTGGLISAHQLSKTTCSTLPLKILMPRHSKSRTR